MDLRPIIGRVGADSWRPCSPTVGGRRRGIGGVGRRRCGPGARAIGRRRDRSSPAASEMGAILQIARSWGPLQRTGMTGYPTILHASAELPSVAGMVENRSAELSVGMLPPSSAAEVCGADEGRYNTGAVLPQGAFYVQSIRAAQTADPRAKQTHPSGPARRSARVNSRPGDGDSPGSMPAGRFRLGREHNNEPKSGLLPG